jgi:pyruvate-formate lyase
MHASASSGNPEESSVANLQAAREALLNPRHQLRSAVALQIGQLNELSVLLTRLQTLVEAAGAAWTSWIERGQAALEDTNRGLRDLAEAKRRQEDTLLMLRQGLTAAKDEDTARLEAGLRNLASAAQELRNATETVSGTGKRFQAQVQEVLQELARRLPEAAGQAGLELGRPIQAFQEAVQPLTWIGGTLGLLVAADLLIRLLR